MLSIPSAIYTLGELGRRAGCTCGEIESWRVAFEADRVLLYPSPQSEAKIVFPWRPRNAAALAAHDGKLARYGWMREPASRIARAIPEFIVPYDDAAEGNVPLFERQDANTIVCRGDVLTATFAALSRAEELYNGERDEHGRFPARASHAARFDYLERPIVDEYGLALEQAITALLPRSTAPPRELHLKLTHDIDLTGYPRSLRTTAGHLYRRRMPRAFVRDLCSAAGFGLPAYAQAILQTAHISRERGLHSAFYWQASPRTAWDSGYDVAHPALRGVIAQLHELGCEQGAHPGYDTFDSPVKLAQEVSRLRGVLRAGPIGGRAHFLRWSPSTWRAWEMAGMAYDSSVGYADAIGFRCGTCVPFRPWLLAEERESTLLEIPLVVMDCTPVRYMGLSPESTLQRVGTLIERCAIAGGVFTLLWHNASVIEPPYAQLYPAILDALAQARAYDWRTDATAPPRPRSVSAAPAV